MGDYNERKGAELAVWKYIDVSDVITSKYVLV